MVSGTLPRRSGTSKTILHRTAFTTSRALEFFTEKELAMQLGFAANFWPIALLKELLDNALDACETAGVAPEITVGGAPDADRPRQWSWLAPVSWSGASTIWCASATKRTT